ncbi:uncharacterized protein LOC130725615 [Lotus japonicus]|uniref:uncharacterized protein LOC130725615 n=1 Tax=Lotus japonicus TaxID=34305 RepID=UPI00258C9386|nr:uncharacterized protein LOC130725615 [Lotus japonicus]
MVDYGVCDSGIVRLLHSRPSFCNFKSCDLLKMLEEVKGLVFDPSKCTFAVALLAMKGGRKNLWDEKVDVFKKWGWSYETVLQAFRRQPNMMLSSIDRIHLVMNFWVNEMGWNSFDLVKMPEIFSFNFQKRVVPRAVVLQFLLKEDLRDKDASLVMPFSLPEKKFLNKFVLCFEVESAYLLKLYEEKMNLASTKKNIGRPFAKFVPHL